MPIFIIIKIFSPFSNRISGLLWVNTGFGACFLHTFVTNLGLLSYVFLPFLPREDFFFLIVYIQFWHQRRDHILKSNVPFTSHHTLQSLKNFFSFMMWCAYLVMNLCMRIMMSCGYKKHINITLIADKVFVQHSPPPTHTFLFMHTYPCVHVHACQCHHIHVHGCTPLLLCACVPLPFHMHMCVHTTCAFARLG